MTEWLILNRLRSGANPDGPEAADLIEALLKRFGELPPDPVYAPRPPAKVRGIDLASLDFNL